MPEIDAPEMEELLRAVESVPTLSLNAAEPAMNAAMTYLHGVIPQYPDRPDGQLKAPDGASFLRTDQQKAWFFAALKQGKIPGWAWMEDESPTGGHPARTQSPRTGTLGRKYTESVRREATAVEGEIGTNAPYAPWVVGPSYPGETINGRTMHQARVHEGRWYQFYDVMSAHYDEAWEEFADTFFPELVKQFREA